MVEERAIRRIALWETGFRPFFLLGCFGGMVLLLTWVWTYALSGPTSTIDVLWHSHEMIHGFAVAIIVGFLLTSSQSWTGVRGIHGAPLMLSAGLWLVGRIAALASTLSPHVVAGIDLAFLPCVAVLLGRYLLRAGQRRNMIFLALLGMLWLSNAAYHLDRLQAWPGAGRQGLLFGVHVIVTMMLVVSGRVIPFFSERSLEGYVRRGRQSLDLAVVGAGAAFTAAHLWNEVSTVTALAATVAGTVSLLRLTLWFDKRVRRLPILWILYAGYAWIVIGFYLSAAAGAGLIASSIATHAFTAGAIGAMIVGMVSRVSLGHTGRPLRASLLTIVAYGLVLGGALVRVFGPMAAPSRYGEMMVLAGGLWSVAIAAILWVYTPKLLFQRADGRVG